MSSIAVKAVDLLRSVGVRLSPGLQPGEFERIERSFGFSFSSDHREFLAIALPSGEGWVDWRDASYEELRSRLDWPVDGVIFDVHENAFWPASWGQRPSGRVEAERQARRHLDRVPTLVPVYSHRYLPAAPAIGPSPVLSVYQADVIYYGEDLSDYVRNEFGEGHRQHFPDTVVHRIDFWSDLVEGIDL